MMNNYCRIVLLIMTGLLSASCVIHEPMSELVMYDKFSDSQKMLQTNSEIMMLDIEQIYEVGGDDNRFRDIIWLNINPNSDSYFPRLHAPLTLSRFNRFRDVAAYALSMGVNTTGFDATIPLRNNNFVTLGLSHLMGGQAIVQRKIFESDNMGFSFGAAYKFEGILFTSIFNEHTLFFHQFGLRTHGIWIPDNSDSFAIKTTLYGGYAVTIDRPVFTIGISLVRF